MASTALPAVASSSLPHPLPLCISTSPPLLPQPHLISMAVTSTSLAFPLTKTAKPFSDPCSSLAERERERERESERQRAWEGGWSAQWLLMEWSTVSNRRHYKLPA